MRGGRRRSGIQNLCRYIRKVVRYVRLKIIQAVGLKYKVPLFLGHENLKAREVVPIKECLNSSGNPRCCSTSLNASWLKGTARRLSARLKLQTPILVHVS